MSYTEKLAKIDRLRRLRLELGDDCKLLRVESVSSNKKVGTRLKCIELFAHFFSPPNLCSSSLNLPTAFKASSSVAGASSSQVKACSKPILIAQAWCSLSRSTGVSREAGSF